MRQLKECIFMDQFQMFIFRRWWEVGIKKWERVKNVGSKEKGRRRKEVNRVVVSHDGAHK